MQWRTELLEPRTAPERLAELAAAVERIETLHWRGESTAEAIAAFNASTGGEYQLEDFLSHHSAMSALDFARTAAWPAWPKVPDITREELIEIVRRILDADDEYGWFLHLLEVNVVHPAPADVIHHPPAHLPDDAPPEDIVDEILKYRPIAL